MNLTFYSIRYEPGWDIHYLSMDNSTQIKIYKKILQLKKPLKGRHLKFGVPCFVEEVGQYRIVYKQLDELQIRKIIFVGDHKQYEQWYKSVMKTM